MSKIKSAIRKLLKIILFLVPLLFSGDAQHHDPVPKPATVDMQPQSG
jgi:hypothetical protein